MPSIWVSDEDYKALIDIKADLERYHKKPASFSDVVSHLMVKKRMLGGKSGKEIKNTRRAIRAKALTAAISTLMLISLISVFQAGTASAQGKPNPTFATVDMTDPYNPTTPSAEISIGWEHEPAIENVPLSGTDAIHVTTSQPTSDYAMVVVPTNFTLENGTEISYWGYTVSGDVKAPDEIFLFLDTDSDGTVDNLLTSHKPGGAASEYYGKWDNWSFNDTANQWHTAIPYTEVLLADFTDNGYTVLAIALTAGPSTAGLPVSVDVYFDNLTVNGDVLLNDDTGTIEVPVPIGAFPAPSIQDAIDAALPGDTIIVAAGEYDGYVDIDKPLTLSGESGAIVKPSISNDWPIISIQADNVTVEGFEVDGSSGGGAIWAGIGSCHYTPDGTTKWNGYKNITIRNNTVHDIQNDTDKGLGISLWRNDGHTYENILIEGNTVYNTGRMGIYIGAIKPDYSEWLLSDNNTIKGNVVHHTMLNPNVGETFPIGCGGIALDAAKNCTIEGNTVYDTANTMPGIFLAHGSAAGNQILGNEVYNQAYGIAVEIDRGDVVFDGDPPATPEVHYNNIHNNDQYGLIVLNAAGEVVDATLNWWGDPSGPSGVGLGSGDAVSANVDYRPWLDAPYQIGEVRSSNVLNESTGAEFDTIQAAINVASSGDTVLVYPGTYNGDIRIGKALTVKSTDGAEKTIIDGVGSYIVIISHSDVTFEGFTVKNPEYTGGADASGILVETVTESVNNVQILNNIVTQVRSETGTPSTFGATGINIGNAPLSNVVVSGNTIENIKNPEGGASDHTCGINVWDGAENVLISNNAISDIKYNGIMLEYASNVRIENNAITKCEVGIRVEPYEGVTVSDLTINYNNIVGNREYGVLNTMIDFIDATLNWWGDPGGPGADEDGNSIYGDNVSANVNYDPWLPRPLPTISDISVSGVTTTSATITWTTALPADSRVEYGPTIAYGLTSSIPDLTTSHSLGLTGLTPSTTYQFRVRSEDAYDHVDNSGDLTFITAAPPPPPATLTVDTTPIKANVYVDGSLLGVALRTRSLAAGTYTISFGDVLGYLTPAPEIVTLAAGETRTVEGVYTEIPPENIENQSPTYELPSITPEENATIPVENSALTEITIQVKNAAENVKITVQEVTEGAAGIAIGAPGATYKYLNIVAENITDAQIESVVIRFKVEKSWIILNEIDIATITLNHYDPLTGEWTSLPTTYLSEDDTYVYFSAISPGLSIFGVSGSTIIPANFELSNLVITPSEVSVGETVTISVVVNNAGGQTGSTTVTLEINGAAVDTQSTTLDAGESTTVTFTVSEDVADTYTVNVAGLTGSFVVTAPPAPPIVPLAVSIIIIVLAIGIVLWLRRIG